MEPNERLIAKKEEWARAKRGLLEDGVAQDQRSRRDRLPPGQHHVNGWPILDLGVHPDLPLDKWTLTVSGLVEQPFTWTWEQFLSQPQAELVNVFGAADCFVVSLQEGLSGFIVPSKLYGILAAGRPYIAAMERDSEAVRIAEQDGCGLTTDPGDPKGLADRVRTLYLNRDLARGMGLRAREAGLRFDRRAGVAAYDALVRGLVNGCSAERLNAAP